MKPWFAAVIFTVLVVPFGGSAQADTASPTYALHDIIGLAIERNPMIAGAMATIDQSTGQRTAAKPRMRVAVTSSPSARSSCRLRSR